MLCVALGVAPAVAGEAAASRVRRRFNRRWLLCATLCATAAPALAQTGGTPQVTLPPVTIEAKKPKAAKKAPPKQAGPAGKAQAAPQSPPAPETATGPVQNYVARRSGTATKTDTPLSEVPQAVTVIGAEQVRDQGAQALQEAVRYVPGVVPDGFGFDSRGDYILIRGIPAAYFLDGMRTAYGFYANTSAIEPYALERIEVLRGPSSMIYGQSPSGGLISMVSKMPQAFRHGEIGVDFGSYDFRQVKVDMGGPITTDGKWLGRFVGLARDSGTQVDFVDNDRIFVAPSLTYRPDADTSVTVAGVWRKDEGGSVQQFLAHAGTLHPNINDQKVPMSRFIGEPTDYNNTDQQSVTLLVDHKFNPWLSVHHGTRYTHTDNTYRTHYTAPLTTDLIAFVNAGIEALSGGFVKNYYNPAAVPFAEPNPSNTQQNIARVFLWRNTETDVFTSDTNLTGKFFTGGIAHKVTGGVDYTRYATGGAGTPILVDNIVPFGFQQPFNIYAPTYGQNAQYLLFGTDQFFTPDNFPVDPRPDEVQTQTGIYIQDQLKLGPWTAVLGIRKDWLSMEMTGRDDVAQSAVTGRAGLMYHFASGFTPYVSYSQAFAAQPGNLVADDPLNPVNLRPADPLKGEQIEIGFKYQPPGLPFMVNVAAFDLKEKNRLVDDILSGFAQQGAEARIRGIEVEAIGKVTENVKVIGTYTFMDSEYTDHFNAYEIGTRVEGVPEHMASLWAIYSFTYGPLQGLSFGSGVRYVGEATDFGKLVTGSLGEVVTPAFTLFDAMVAYETKNWRWQLTGTNLEDEYHVITCTARGDCGVGQGRTVITSFTYKF